MTAHHVGAGWNLDPSTPPPGPCPDCGAEVVDRRQTHDATCPIGRSLDESSEADRLWFEAHPNATEYYRPLAMCDRDVALSGLPEGAYLLSSRLRVVKATPSLRFRCYRELLVAVPR